MDGWRKPNSDSDCTTIGHNASCSGRRRRHPDRANSVAMKSTADDWRRRNLDRSDATSRRHARRCRYRSHRLHRAIASPSRPILDDGHRTTLSGADATIGHHASDDDCRMRPNRILRGLHNNLGRNSLDQIVRKPARRS